MEDWAELGRRVASARAYAGHQTQDSFAAVIPGVSKRTLATLEAGHPVSPPTLAAVELALGWPEGECRRILTVDQDGLMAKLAAVSPQVRQALLAVLDAAIAQEQAQGAGDPSPPGHDAAAAG